MFFKFGHSKPHPILIKKRVKIENRKTSLPDYFCKGSSELCIFCFYNPQSATFFISLIFLRVNRLAIEAKIPQKKYAQKVCTVQNFLYLCTAFRKNAGH